MKSFDAIREYGKREGRAEGMLQGRKDAQIEERRLLAIGLIRDGLYALDKIAVLCHMTLQQVQDLAISLKAH